MPRPKPCEHGWKSALEDRFQDQFRAAWTTRSRTVGMPSLRSFPLDFGIIRSRTGNGRSPAFKSARRSVRRTTPPRARLRCSGRSCRPPQPCAHPGSPCTRAQAMAKNAGSTTRLNRSSNRRAASSPARSVQLGLDLQYPNPVIDRTRRVGIHRRPPDLPAPALRTRRRPWPCGRSSRPRTTTAAPPHQQGLGGRCACPRPARLA